MEFLIGIVGSVIALIGVTFTVLTMWANTEKQAGDLYVLPGGTGVSSLETPDRELMDKYQVNAIMQMNAVKRERLSRLAEMVDQGIIKVHVERTFPLEEAGEAMTYLQTVHPRGKVVIDVK